VARVSYRISTKVTETFSIVIIRDIIVNAKDYISFGVELFVL
jgi:hypothetical protein